MSDPKDFTHFGLDPLLLAAITEMGYATPTPIQAKALRKLRHPSRSEKLRSFLEGE